MDVVSQEQVTAWTTAPVLVPPQRGPGGDAAVTEDPLPRRLLEAADVRYAQWDVPTLARVCALAACSVAVCAGSLVWTSGVKGADHSEYFAVVAGGLLTLAGILPAVVGVLVGTKPVTRLDAGRVLLHGWVRPAVTAYGVLWAVALVLPLLSLAGDVLDGSLARGLQLCLTLIVTLSTPTLLFGLSARLQPGESTRIAVSRAVWADGSPVPRSVEALMDRSPRLRRAAAAAGRAVQRMTGPSSREAARQRVHLVQELRDIALNEAATGDRRAVKHRMEGLATIAVLTPDDALACQSLDELGLVAQQAVKDRDLALEGLECLLAAGGRALHGHQDERVRRVARECIGVWCDALERGASPLLGERAARGVADLLAGRPDLRAEALGQLLASVGAADGVLLPGSADLRTLTDGLSLAAVSQHQPSVVRPWVAVCERRGPAALPYLADFLATRVRSGKDVTDLTREVIAALARVLLAAREGTAVSRRRMRDELRAHVQLDGALWVAIALQGHGVVREAEDPARSVLLSEVLLALPWVPPSAQLAVAQRFDSVHADQLIEAIPVLTESLAALLDRMDELAATAGQPPAAALHSAVASMVSLLLRTVTRHRPEADTSTQAVLALVERATRPGRTSPLDDDAEDTLRRRLAAQVHQLRTSDPSRATARAYRLLPFLLGSEDRFALSWLASLETSDVAPDEALLRRLTASDSLPRLLELRGSVVAQDGDSPLDLPPGDALRGATNGQALAFLDRLLRSQLAGADHDRPSEGLASLRAWAAAAPGARAAAASQALLDLWPEQDLPWPLQLAVLDLGLREHRLRRGPGTDWRKPARPASDLTWRWVEEHLATAGPLLAGRPEPEVDGALSALALAWTDGLLRGRPATPDALDAAALLVRQRPHVRSSVAGALRAAHERQRQVPPAAQEGLARAFCDVGDVRTAGALVVCMLRRAPRRLQQVLPVFELALSRAAHGSGTCALELARALDEALDRYVTDPSRCAPSAALAALVLDVGTRLPEDPHSRSAAELVQRMTARHASGAWPIGLDRESAALTRRRSGPAVDEDDQEPAAAADASTDLQPAARR